MGLICAECVLADQKAAICTQTFKEWCNLVLSPILHTNFAQFCGSVIEIADQLLADGRTGSTAMRTLVSYALWPGEQGAA